MVRVSIKILRKMLYYNEM